MSNRRIEPSFGQESVWDYPRPPRLEAVAHALRVVVAGQVVAETTRGYRVLETSHPPTYYLPPADVHFLRRASGRSFCEWKGEAVYWDIVVGDEVRLRAGWSYPSPSVAFADIRDHVAFYASRVDACYVGDERVMAQPGDFYGGWITAAIVGPFKGSAGTGGW